MCTGRSTFSRTHAVALGTVQIMIGVMVFLFGVVLFIQVDMAAGADSLAVHSFFFVWGAGIFITAGSLTVAAGKSSNRCLMNTTLAFNVIATVAACAATILYAFVAIICGIFVGSFGCYDKKIGFGNLLAVIVFLEFIISIVISVSVCKSTCDCCNQPSEYSVAADPSVNFQAPPSYSAPATMVQLPLQPSEYNVPGDSSVDLQAPPSYSASATMVQLPLQMKNVSYPAAGQSSLGLMDPPPYSET